MLVSHSPLLGHLDVTIGGRHTGSKALATAVPRARPRLHVCGHVHEGRGVSGLGSYKNCLSDRQKLRRTQGAGRERPTDALRARSVGHVRVARRLGSRSPSVCCAPDPRGLDEVGNLHRWSFCVYVADPFELAGGTVAFQSQVAAN